MARRLENILASDRLDVLEEELPRRRWCNAKNEHGERCNAKVTQVRGGVFSERQLCREHSFLYSDHDIILARIRALSDRP